MFTLDFLEYSVIDKCKLQCNVQIFCEIDHLKIVKQKKKKQSKNTKTKKSCAFVFSLSE